MVLCFNKKRAKANKEAAEVQNGFNKNQGRRKLPSPMHYLLRTSDASAYMNVPCRGENLRKLQKTSTWRWLKASSLGSYQRKHLNIAKRKPKEPHCGFYAFSSDQRETGNANRSPPLLCRMEDPVDASSMNKQSEVSGSPWS
jgi:hypothetical protein